MRYCELCWHYRPQIVSDPKLPLDACSFGVTGMVFHKICSYCVFCCEPLAVILSSCLCCSGLRVVGATIQGSKVALSSEVAVEIPLGALIWTKLVLQTACV